MKVLSIKEPHASLLLSPYKNIETRSWKTNYRGPLLLHASKTMPSANGHPEILTLIDLYKNWAKETGRRTYFLSGFIYARAELVDCVQMTEENIRQLTIDNPSEVACGYYSPGRWMWKLENIQPLDSPIHINGQLGLWDLYGYDEYENDDDDYRRTPSSTAGDYGPSNPWDAPGMSISDFI